MTFPDYAQETLPLFSVLFKFLGLICSLRRVHFSLQISVFTSHNFLHKMKGILFYLLFFFIELV